MTKSNLFRKLRTAGALIIVFLLIYGTNRLDKHHFENVQHLMNSVYEDRVVAQHYIYQLNNLYHLKYEHVLGSVEEKAIEDINKEIGQYIDMFAATTLTTKEARVFQLLQERNEELKALGIQLAPKPTNNISQDDIRQFETKLDKIFESLDGLSEIQLNEGARLRKMAEESLDTNTFFAQLEMLVLIVIGIIIQVVIFYRPKTD